MPTITLSGTEVAQLIAVVLGQHGYTRMKSKEAAVERLKKVLTEKVGPAVAKMYWNEIIFAANIAAAKDKLGVALLAGAPAKTEDKPAAQPVITAEGHAAIRVASKKVADEIVKRRDSRKAALQVVADNTPKAKPAAAPKAAPAAAPKADKPAAAAKAVSVRKGLADTIKTKPGAKLRADGLEDGGVDAKLIDACLVDGGALHEALCQLVGWKACDRRLARAAQVGGYTLTKTKEGTDWRFTAKRANGKAA